MPLSRLTRSAVVLAAAAVLSGCAAKPKTAAQQQPPELQTLAELPPIALPEPAAQPKESVPLEALQLYAQGRDLLLQNKKTQAQKQLAAALQLDPTSAVAHRDLAYAWLGFDSSKAQVEFRQAIAYDPLDADSHVQLARLLVAAKQYNEAILQLRLARLTPDFQDDDSLAAMTDLLLGRLLQGSRPLAALECYEHVIALVDAGQIQLRGRPELAELLRQPDILVIQAGDLALLVGQYAKAAALYERVKQDNPQAASMLEMRIASAEIASGAANRGTRRALTIVEQQNASFSSMLGFVKLFDHNGGSAEALKQLSRLRVESDEDTSSRAVLRSWLLLRAGDANAAADEIDRAKRSDLMAVRQLVHAYRAAGQDSALLLTLLKRLADQPQQWPSLQRGWAVLSQIGQPKPLAAATVENLDVPANLQAAKLFVAAQLHVTQGEPVVAKQLLEKVRAADPGFAKAVVSNAAPVLQPDDAFDDTEGLADLLVDESDDPELIAALAGQLLQQGQEAILLEAMHIANLRQPLNVVLAGSYAQVLSADEQRTEAIAVLDHASGAKSASELYFLSSQYSGLGENKSAERVLRRALEIDPTNVAVCNDLGFLLADDGRELDQAETLLNRAVAAAPKNPAYLDSLGWLLYKRSKFADSADYMAQAIAASDPADPVVLDHAGDAFYRNKEADKAAKAWNEAIIAIRDRGTNDPQLRLRIERKLKQAADKQAVDLAPLAIKK